MRRQLANQTGVTDVQCAALLALGNLAFERTNRRTMLASEGLRELLTRLGSGTGDGTRTPPLHNFGAPQCGRGRRGRMDLVGSHARWKGPLPSNSPHDHMILRVDLVGSHGRWKRPCHQTAHMTI